jgi:hypothetical protein
MKEAYLQDVLLVFLFECSFTHGAPVYSLSVVASKRRYPQDVGRWNAATLCAIIRSVA